MDNLIDVLLPLGEFLLDSENSHLLLVLNVKILDFSHSQKPCGSNPISATSEVLRIQQGSKDFFLFYLDFHKMSYFYIYSFLDRSIWAASGRRVSVMLPEGQVRRPQSA